MVQNDKTCLIIVSFIIMDWCTHNVLCTNRRLLSVFTIINSSDIWVWRSRNVQAFCSSLQTNYTIEQNTQQDTQICYATTRCDKVTSFSTWKYYSFWYFILSSILFNINRRCVLIQKLDTQRRLPCKSYIFVCFFEAGKRKKLWNHQLIKQTVDDNKYITYKNRYHILDSMIEIPTSGFVFCTLYLLINTVMWCRYFCFLPLQFSIQKWSVDPWIFNIKEHE